VPFAPAACCASAGCGGRSTGAAAAAAAAVVAPCIAASSNIACCGTMPTGICSKTGIAFRTRTQVALHQSTFDATPVQTGGGCGQKWQHIVVCLTPPSVQMAVQTEVGDNEGELLARGRRRGGPPSRPMPDWIPGRQKPAARGMISRNSSRHEAPGEVLAGDGAQPTPMQYLCSARRQRGHRECRECRDATVSGGKSCGRTISGSCSCGTGTSNSRWMHGCTWGWTGGGTTATHGMRNRRQADTAVISWLHGGHTHTHVKCDRSGDPRQASQVDPRRQEGRPSHASARQHIRHNRDGVQWPTGEATHPAGVLGHTV